ncbi:MAG: LuxR C-terminal-related transcriptional regulator [Actinomycetota bacterium]
MSNDPRGPEELLSGSQMLPGSQVLGVVGRVDEVMGRTPDEAPDVVLLDARGSVENGLEAVGRIRRETEALVILVTDRDDPSVLSAAMTSGASGVLRRSAAAETVAGAIQVVRAGGFYLEGSRARDMVEAMEALRGQGSRIGVGALTPREAEVLRLLAEGLSARQIGRRLELSERTVNTHVANLYRKLGVSNRVEAVREALRMGIVTQE